MRYLWVEDFGEDSEDQEDKQDEWERYFGIEDNILKNSLEDALIFLDNLENHIKFDAILLDIRFPVLSDNSTIDEIEIYNTYFAKIITEDMFKKYASSDVMKDASSGILLFLALVFRYGYSWNNIAFISANIDDEDLSAITSLKELLIKVKYGEQLSGREKSLYKTRYRDLFSDNDGIATKKIGLIEEAFRIITCDNLSCDLEQDIYNNEIKKLSTIQEKINGGVPEIKKEGLKYCSVRNQFEMIGLKMPPAFEKPNDESLQICWLFKEWKDTRCDSLTTTKRLVIDMCDLLKDNIEGNVDSFLKMQRIYNDDDCSMTEGNIRQYLQNIIRCASNYPKIKNQENIKMYATAIVETSSALWESIKKPDVIKKDVSSYYRYSYYSVMRLTRNWMAHQGIKGIDIQFATFVFLISIKGVFDVSKFNKNVIRKYRELEKALIKNFAYEPINVGLLDIKEIMQNEYAATEERVRKAIPHNYSSTMRIPSTLFPFALISALGHEHSCVRDSVSTVELYRVFWMCIYFGDGKSGAIDLQKIDSDSIINILESIYTYQKL